MLKLRAAIAAAVVALATGAIAPAATPDAGTLGPELENQLVTWSGEFPTTYLNPLLVLAPAPVIRCLQAGACDDFTLTVALDDFWATNGDGAVEVALRWAYDGVTDIDLQVLDDAGAIVAQSAGVDSNAESVFIPNLADGVYTVRAIPTNTVNPDAQADSVPYEGLAQVEPLATDPIGQGHAQLPNLRPARPDVFHISSALNLIPFPENPLLSCYPEETLQNEGMPTRCLRFNQTIANIGEGPLVLRFGLSGIVTPDTADNLIRQRISWSDGTFRDLVAPETYVFHEVHAHLHYQGFGQTLLYPWDSTNERADTPISIGRKVGFCIIDVELQDEYWKQTGNGPRAHTFPLSCVLPKDIDPSGPQAWVEEGVAVGWADIYGWNLADQYIDITSVPDGVYELVQIANPNHSVVEQTVTDNCASTIIELAGDSVTDLGFGSFDCPD